MPSAAAVKQLAPTGTHGREDVLEIRCRARCRAQGRRIQDATSSGKKRKTDKAAADLEPAGADVFVRHSVTRQMQDRPEKKGCKPRAASGAASSAGGDMEGDDHLPRLVAREDVRRLSNGRRQTFDRA